MRLSLPRVLIAVLAVIGTMTAGISLGEILVIPFKNEQPHTTILATRWNQNMAAIESIVNGAIDDQNIKTGGITASSKLVDASINAAKIGTGAVTTAGILDGTIDTVDLKDSSVNSAKIADLSIDTPDLKNGSVTTPKLAAGGISGSVIQDGTVTGAKIAKSGSFNDRQFLRYNSGSDLFVSTPMCSYDWTVTFTGASGSGNTTYYALGIGGTNGITLSTSAVAPIPWNSYVAQATVLTLTALANTRTFSLCDSTGGTCATLCAINNGQTQCQSGAIPGTTFATLQRVALRAADTGSPSAAITYVHICMHGS